MDSPLSIFDESFAESLELLRAKVRIGTRAKCPANLTACCEQIHRAYIWLEMYDDPLAGQFRELLTKAQDALSEIREQSNFQTTYKIY
jgi:hypothetical protein